jgi:beta-galactosidase
MRRGRGYSNGIACGADTILFWCWRDEVFGSETNGYGLSGGDGLATERLEAMRVTGNVLDAHRALIDGYRPAAATVGVLLSPQSYYLQYAETGSGYGTAAAFHGYCRALVRNPIPFVAVEEEHLDTLDALQLLFLPRTLVFMPTVEAALTRFLEQGGTVVCESECGAFNPQGFYRYPADRLLARLTGVQEVGRRLLTEPALSAELDGQPLEMGLAQWLTPLETSRGSVHATHPEGSLLSSLPVGNGTVIYCGGYPGEAYRAKPNTGFERFVAWAVRSAGVQSEIEVLSPQPDPASFLYVKHGMSRNRRIVFVFFQKDHLVAHLRFRKGFFASDSVRDLITGAVHRLAPGPLDTTELKINCPDWRFAVLAEEERI